ncbi:CHRD domain-containing protein [Rhodohalobacter sp. 8-1]|uniref:CHRD domain-containing protein n=1 Tax=Rhodohalobacter sp. 8-1 TaxID=3131972 RepID=UPI0030ECB95E
MRLRHGLAASFIFTFWVIPALAQVSSETTLAGYNHIPVVQTPAIGFATITIESDSLFIEGEFHDLRGVYRAAYVQYGKIGKSGHRMLRLKPEIAESITAGVFKKEENAFILTDALRNSLREGQLYINVTSNRHQLGEIRGQIPKM